MTRQLGGAKRRKIIIHTHSNINMLLYGRTWGHRRRSRRCKKWLQSLCGPPCEVVLVQTSTPRTNPAVHHTVWRHNNHHYYRLQAHGRQMVDRYSDEASNTRACEMPKAFGRPSTFNIDLRLGCPSILIDGRSMPILVLRHDTTIHSPITQRTMISSARDDEPNRSQKHRYECE